MPSPSTGLSATFSPAPRLRSLDLFRGATIVGMILVNGQFSHEASYRPLTHAAWHGWTLADTIFPCFLFIVGVSLTLSTASRLAHGEGHTRLITHAVARSLLLFACGVVLDALLVPVREFPFIAFRSQLQLTGVLQKIAVCYLAAFHISLWSGLRGVTAAIVGLNLGYLGLLYFYPVPGCGAGSLVVACNFPGYLDEVVLDGFKSSDLAFDPDGLGAILSAITSVLFGVAAGHLLLKEHSPWLRVLWLLGAGLVLIAAGELFSMWVPINKQLWTPSFAVLMAGLGTTALACFIWRVDDRPLQRWQTPLEIFGLNAIAAYVISRLVGNLPKVHLMGKSLHTDVLAPVASPPMASLLFAMVVLTLVYVAVWLMHRRNWHLKL